MPMVVSTFELRDPEKVRDWGLALVQFCRAHRGRPGVIDAKYWLRGVSSAVVQVQVEPGANPFEGVQDPTFATSLAELARLSSSSPMEVWADAGQASNTLAAGGR